MDLILDVSRCVFSDRACVLCLCGDAPSGPRAAVIADHHPVRNQPTTFSWSPLPARLTEQPAQPSKTLCALPSKFPFVAHTQPTTLPALWPPLPWWCACGCGQHLLALLVLSKEWIIIPGQAASATNLKEIIAERVKRKKNGTSIQPAIRVIKLG